MNIESQRQLENSRAKLKLLEGRLKELDAQPVTNLQTRELTKRSLKKLTNQLKGEIIRFESHRAPAKILAPDEIAIAHVMNHAFGEKVDG